MNGARSLLFVPVTSERKVERAFESNAEGVILDLEDSVAVSQKSVARRALSTILSSVRPLPAYVRVNATSTPHCFQDLLAVTIAAVAGVIVPKVESADEIKTVDWVMTQLEAERNLPPRSVALMAIIETAKGLTAVDAIAAASPRLRRLVFGAVDLASDMMIDLDDEAGAPALARFAIARASRAALLESPLDTAFVDIHDQQRLRATSVRARALGFSGKVCIHPGQIDIVNQVFTPGPEELERAARIVGAFELAEAQGHAAVSVDGQMVDYPVVVRARRILALAPRTK